jgi:hypothetical protein
MYFIGASLYIKVGQLLALGHITQLFYGMSQGLIVEASRSHSRHTTHHTRKDSSGRVISPSHRPLPDHRQHSQKTYIRAPGEIQTRSSIKRAAADPRPRPRGHRITFLILCVLLGKGKPSDYSILCRRFLRDIRSHLQN